nr:hypothetical protein RSP673_19510 [Ralstonia solanacearum P673]
MRTLHTRMPVPGELGWPLVFNQVAVGTCRLAVLAGAMGSGKSIRCEGNVDIDSLKWRIRHI